jgi:hypothetical protein
VWQLDWHILIAVRGFNIVVLALPFVVVSKDVVCTVEVVVGELIVIVPLSIRCDGLLRS